MKKKSMKRLKLMTDEPVTGKVWWKSKTIAAAFIAFLLAVLQAAHDGAGYGSLATLVLASAIAALRLINGDLKLWA